MNPKPFLESLRGKKVVVRLKWADTDYKGTLVSTDSYMNLQLRNAEEIINNENKGALDEVLIRCNNVMWVAPAE